jgi:hypothetical protein
MVGTSASTIRVLGLFAFLPAVNAGCSAHFMYRSWVIVLRLMALRLSLVLL